MYHSLNNTAVYAVIFILLSLDIAHSGVIVEHEKSVNSPINIGKALYLQNACSISQYVYLHESIYCVTYQLFLYIHYAFTIIENKLDLIRLLSPIEYKWRQIGHALRVSHLDLENILNQRNHNVDRLASDKFHIILLR